ncbi:AsmA family protein [Arenicella xantha]|uniref:Uncharacterized protein involved in outer membrane biogenesis n=1 Tax=Arenicella xantha TaxID=644221 RepID=A0A395JNA2_9GAMM|nr:AsmA family protein [Arenicella xantha]RBP53131.1 uncharacterized protein involved in outer membrane biogenesis [Arenicella xantha]
MLKLLKWIAGTLLTVALLVLVAAIVIPAVIDPNDYRDELTALVKDKTGREMRLEGDLSVSVFPWLGIRTEGLHFAQPESIGGDMVSVDSAQLRVKLIPLLSKRVEVDTVVLEQPTIRLVTLKNGVDSWSGLLSDGEPDAANGASADSGSDASGAAVALVVQGVKLTDGTIVLDDRQAGSRTEIKQLNLATGNLIGDSLADFNASGQLFQSDATSASGYNQTKFDLGARAKIDRESLAAELERLQVELIQVDQTVQLEVDSIAVSPQQVISLFGASVSVSGAQAIDLSLPDATINLTQQTLDAPQLVATIANLNATISDARITKLMDAPRVTGRVEVSEFNANKLLSEFDVDYSPTNSNALNAVSLKAAFVADMESAALSELVLVVDQSHLTGSASIRNFTNPAMQFDLSLDSLNLDNYLPKADESQGLSASKPVSGGEALAIPMAAFHAVNANGRFRAKQFIAGGVQLSNIDVTVVSQDGNVSITPVANLYQGKLEGEIAYQQQSDQAQLRVKQNMDLVQLGELLTDADITDQLRGVGMLDVDVTVTERAGKQSNQGVIKLLASNGSLNGIDMLGLLAQANTVANLLSKGEQQQADATADKEVQSKQSDVTKFGELIGTFSLNDFQLSNNDLKLVAPGLLVTGFGEVDLATQTLDYNLRVVVQEGIDGVIGEKLSKLQGYTIPVRCRGSFEAPSCLPDMQALYKAYAKTKLDTKKGELLKEKYGIEGGEKLSTADAIKQVLIQKALKKDKNNSSQEAKPPVGERDGAVEATEQQPATPGKERPISERQAEPEVQTEQSVSGDQAFSNVPVSSDPAPVADTPPEPELNEKQKRRAERKKLLEQLLSPSDG